MSVVSILDSYVARAFVLFREKYYKDGELIVWKFVASLFALLTFILAVVSEVIGIIESRSRDYALKFIYIVFCASSSISVLFLCSRGFIFKETRRLFLIIWIATFLLVEWFALPILANIYYFEKIEVNNELVTPIPNAKPNEFTVLIANLENDNTKDDTAILLESLRQRVQGIKVEPLGRGIKGMRLSSTDVLEKARQEARDYLKKSGAQVLIWGTVDKGGVRGIRVYMEVSEGNGDESTRNYLFSDGGIELKIDDDLGDVLSMSVLTQKNIMSSEDSHSIYYLSKHINKVKRLLGVKNISLEKKVMIQGNVAVSLMALGGKSGDINDFLEAVDLLKKCLESISVSKNANSWAMAQNNLGNALWMLGERETGSEHLIQAVAAYQAALTIWTRDKAPLDWAMVQNNLGNACSDLGKREAGTERLTQAVAAYQAALTIWTRDKAPLDWAMAQDNLGSAYSRLGGREVGTEYLAKAIVAYQAALLERTQDKNPFLWALSQNNLGNTFSRLGEREVGTEHLTQAVTAYQAALTIWTCDKTPSNWAVTQNNLGSALSSLGEREVGTEHLTQAVTAYQAALTIWTHDKAPSNWAITQNNLGSALSRLGEREVGTEHLTQAVTAYQEALTERTQDKAPLGWAMIQNNLSSTLSQLGERTRATDKISQALDGHLSAWEIFVDVDNYQVRKSFLGICEDLRIGEKFQSFNSMLLTKYKKKISRVTSWAKKNNINCSQMHL